MKEVAKALNFHPNPSAQFLRSNATRIIAAILPEINTFFFPELLEGISKVAEAHGYSLIFLQSGNSLKKEMELVEFCLQTFARGVLISLSAETCDVTHLMKLREAEIPVLLIDRVLENAYFPYVTIDEKQVAFDAASYLIRKGHSRLLGVFDDPRLRMSQARAEGFRLALAANNLPFEPSAIVMCNDPNFLEDRITALLDANPEATALFTMSDILMVKTYHVINSLGLKIPDDLALIAISDGKAPSYLFPGITHIRHSGEEVGIISTGYLFDIIEGKQELSGFYPIKTALVELGSV